MKARIFLSILLVVAGLAILSIPVAAAAPPGGTGYVTFTVNVDGAQLYIDGNYIDTISGYSYDYPANGVDGSYRITRDGYEDATGTYTFLIGGAPNIEKSVTLNPKPVGSGKGYFTVYCNVDGASVYFDGAYKKMISNGAATIEVSTTATPYQYFSVSKSGYQTYTGSVSTMPGNGEYISLYATLNPIPTSVPTTIPTPYPTTIGGDVAYYLIHANVNGASVYFDNEYKGVISNGVLNVAVYTTGTPYSTYRVERSGYQSSTGMLPPTPAKGTTRDVYVTLDPIAEPTVTGVVGGDEGWYVVHANVDGATVTFGNDVKGLIASGTLTVPYYSTGTPYTTFTVKKAGYTPYTGTISSYPSKGQSIDLYATLNPAMTSAPTAAPTKSPVPAGITVLALIFGVAGVALLAKRS